MIILLDEYNDHIYKLLKNHKFKFPIKITAFTENLVHDIDYMTIRYEHKYNSYNKL